MGGLSFPPVLPQDRWGASTGARPRSKLRGGSLDETTIRQLRDATGHRYPLLQEAIGSGAKRAGEKPNAIASAAQTRASGAFAAVWGDVQQPQFSIFDHCQKRGQAMHQSQCQHPNCPHWSNGSRSMVAPERSPSLACRRRAHHLTTHAISIHSSNILILTITI